MRLLLAGLLLAPAVAVAQPYAPPPPPPADGRSGGGAPEEPAPYGGPSSQAPSPQPAPYSPPTPYPQQPYSPQPYAPQGYYPQQQQQQGFYQPPPPPPTGRALRHGATFEVGLGVGWINAGANGNSETSDAGALFTIGGGGWLTPDLALTGRISVVGIEQAGTSFSHTVVSLNLQRYVSDLFWLGGGVGVASAASDSSSDSIEGFGLNLRAGINFTSSSEHVFNAHFELFPAFYEDDGFDFRYTGIGFGIGYQHL